MKIISILILLFSTAMLSANTDCSNPVKNVLIEKKAIPLKPEYIEMVARQIFTDETGLSDFIGIECHAINDDQKDYWLCRIRQSATRFENDKYTVNPPGVGSWMLKINFLDNTYELG